MYYLIFLQKGKSTLKYGLSIARQGYSYFVKCFYSDFTDVRTKQKVHTSGKCSATTYEYSRKKYNQEPHSFSHSLLAKHTATLSWVTGLLKEHEVLQVNTEKQSYEIHIWMVI